MSSVMYEMFEWLLTIIAPADQADNYNGQQGDIWDAQKDMALAMLGGIFAWASFSIKTAFLRKSEK